MSDSNSSFATLFQRAAAGEVAATDRLLARYRVRLELMVRMHMGKQLAQRFDASDIVHDAFSVAAERLEQFENASVPFYVWLRQITCDRLSELYQRHVNSKKRSTSLEQEKELSQDLVERLAFRLGGGDGTTFGESVDSELQQRLHQTLSNLPREQLEVLEMRNLEKMSIGEIASASGLSERAVKMNQLRAVESLRTLFHSHPDRLQ